MSEPKLGFTVEPFSRLVEVVQTASRAPFARPVDQVRYLESYLGAPEADAKSILVEWPYVDRHWLEEYVGYYSTTLRPPPAKATRLHFLRDEWTSETLVGLLSRAIKGERTQVIDELQRAYLGFCVIRPLASAPVGRTVLRPYEGDAHRCYAAAQLPNRVHLAGLTVAVQGLPFQQQDQGVGACATTAIWTALTKVMRTDGSRAPTPLAITMAATSKRSRGRAFPANMGLDLEQMAAAVNAHDYQPHIFKPSDEPDDFVLSLKTYLRSGIPVIVRVQMEGGEVHALTFVGFRERSDSRVHANVISVGGDAKFRSRGVEHWYVHDDRLGAYCRLGFVRDADGVVDHQRIVLLPKEAGFEEFTRPMVFWQAMVPLYPKLRLTAEELLQFALDFVAPLRFLAKSEELYLEPQFFLGGEYLHELQQRPVETDRLVQISTTVLLSRYVGVLSWYRDDEWICDAVYDTTDLRRDSRTHPPLIAIVPRDPAWLPSMRQQQLRWGPGCVIG